MVTYKSAKATLTLLVLSAWLVAACSPRTSIPSGEDTIPHLEELVNAVSSGSNEDLMALVRFSSLPCTHKEGLGGPPKCLAGETEGTLVDVLPVLGSEGGHIRRSEFSSWPSIGEAQLYAAFRTSKSAYSDEFFPAGEFGVAFLLSPSNAVVFQVTDEGIVRLDYPAMPFEEVLNSNEVIFGPYPLNK
jgi:hypothetical protein